MEIPICVGRTQEISYVIIHFQTRIFVTHNLTYLSQVDYIIVLENGMISEQGTYEELWDKGGNFADILVSYFKDNEESSSEFSKESHLYHHKFNITQFEFSP